jgi:hypothetical protein
MVQEGMVIRVTVRVGLQGSGAVRSQDERTIQKLVTVV